MVFILFSFHALGVVLAHVAQAPFLLVIVCLPTLPYIKDCFRVELFSVSRKAMLEQILLVVVLGGFMCAVNGRVPINPRWLSTWTDAGLYLLFVIAQHTFYVRLVPLSLKRRKPQKVALLSAVLFIIPHLLWSWGPLSTITTGVLMWRWCFITLESGSMGASLLGHVTIGLLQRWFGFDL